MLRLTTALCATLCTVLALLSTASFAETSPKAPTTSTSTAAQSDPAMLPEKDLTRYLVCGFLHKEGSYKIGSYIMNEYPIQWTTHHEEYQTLVENKLTEISQQQNVSKFKAEDTLYSKYQCASAYADLLQFDTSKI
ncbi:hypothetical protein HC725_08715 [Vibrio sp. S17_S38]|uniref:hypothetical protein n=1 Tax=Vibrio sp. S17_S38 TaxID=2720229 RepID=UPI001680548F|nr:hypothetical protein [Vibrio sp. S17_S38]MBD1573354.1 hypothetical protein [Vibrio sp. S17_S38]